MKLSKEELIAKVNEKIENVDLAIELIEDITDSFELADTSELDNKISELTEELSNLKEKYKNRFLGIPENPGETSGAGEGEKVPELETKDVVDIKEI
jgi:hypothetical protein